MTFLLGFATLLIALVAISIDRLVDVSRFRCFAWFHFLEKKAYSLAPKLPALLTIACLILPVVLIVGLIDCLLSHWWYGMLDLLFGILVLLYCLGPKSVYRDPDVATLDSQVLLTASLAQVFSVLFWFMCFGVAGAILYRLVALPSCGVDDATQTEKIKRVQEQIKALLDWLPVRLLSLTFALVGSFLKVFNRWRKLSASGILANVNVLGECGSAAIDKTEKDIQVTTDSTQERLLALLDRALVVWLFVFALVVVI